MLGAALCVSVERTPYVMGAVDSLTLKRRQPELAYPTEPAAKQTPVHILERKQENRGTCCTSAGTVPVGLSAGFLHPGGGPMAEEALQALIFGVTDLSK
ncbi:hypothetical protein QTO34_016417 [Cnephaeus nilssonii]|uniref:Uncharacterized protein n=1 Tax=Cnephaeus nilssonii TaxID=3371016 RepID=A0AA40LTS5_CNENI|nr:hypothetical protein QTO34_016417 [Eptesicus nilssonii]